MSAYDWLDIISVNLLPAENVPLHHTENYAWQRPSAAVVRRGQAFSIRLTTNDIRFDPRLHTLRVYLMLDESVNRPTVISIPIWHKEHRDLILPDTWAAYLTKTEANHLTVAVEVPVNAPVAVWKVYILRGTYDTRLLSRIDLEYTKFSRLSPPPKLYVLFNPYNAADDVYQPENKILDAYLNLEGDVYFTGVVSDEQDYTIDKYAWMHSQFDEDTLKVTMYLLAVLTYNHERNGPGLSFAERGNVLRVSRKLSFAVNGYLLEGNWIKGTILDGTKPTSWFGTDQIIAEFIRGNKQRVRYAQCWVFACTFVTLLRSIGVPCRLVTCLNSGHDSDDTLTIDKRFIRTPLGGFREADIYRDRIGSEMIWNFHVWTEIWAMRRDLEEGYDGWQVVDATPQERSYDVSSTGKSYEAYQCGPIPVKAIREGRLDIPYDALFVYGEVNSDEVCWFYEEDYHGNLKLLTAYTKKYTSNVGVALITTDPRHLGSPMNITSSYKPTEGTDYERHVHVKALKSAGITERNKRIRSLYNRDLSISEAPIGDIVVSISKIPSIPFGDDILFTIALHNSSKNTRTIKFTIRVVTQMHTGETSDEISEEAKEVTVDGEETVTLSHTVGVHEYVDYVTDHKELAVFASGSVFETSQIFIETVKFQVVGSLLVLDVPKTVKVNETIRAVVTFTNPLSTDLEDVLLTLYSGTSNSAVKIERFPKSIKGYQKVKITIKFRAINKGVRMLMVTVSSKQIKNVSENKYILAVDPDGLLQPVSEQQ